MKKSLLLLLLLACFPCGDSSSVVYGGSHCATPIVQAYYINSWCFYASLQSLTGIPQCASGSYGTSLQTGSGTINCCEGNYSLLKCNQGATASTIRTICSENGLGNIIGLPFAFNETTDGQLPRICIELYSNISGHAYVAYEITTWGSPQNGDWGAIVYGMCPTLARYDVYHYSHFTPNIYAIR